MPDSDDSYDDFRYDLSGGAPSMPSRNAAANASASSLQGILMENPDKFIALNPHDMYNDGQRKQMHELNNKLKVYMKNNKELDAEIDNLRRKIERAKNNANYQDDDIKRKIADIHKKKSDINSLRVEQKKANIEYEKVQLRNQNLEGDIQHYDKQIKELEAKIRHCDDEIRDADAEIRSDQAAIKELKPRRDQLEREQREREQKHNQEIAALLLNRKKQSVPDVPSCEETWPKMLENFRKKHVNGKAAKPAEIKKLEDLVIKARNRNKELDKQVMETKREKDRLELELRKLEAEIESKKTETENVRNLMKMVEESHKKELEIMEQRIHDLQKEQRDLQAQLDEALNDLHQVQNRGAPPSQGKKEPIEKEVNRMTDLLGNSVNISKDH